MDKLGQIINAPTKQPQQTVRIGGIEYSSVCTCGGEGKLYPVVNGKPDYSRLIICICQREKVESARRQHLRERCELPVGVEKLTLETYQTKGLPTLVEALKSAKELADGKLEWLTLAGHVDLGKTHLAIGICQRWLARDMAALYLASPRMLVWLKDAFEREKAGADNLSFLQRMKVLEQVDLLVIDDLGSEKPSQFATEQITSLVDYRYINHLPLVVTTNKPINQLPGDDEGRIASRLKRYENGKVIILDGPEYRMVRK